MQSHVLLSRLCSTLFRAFLGILHIASTFRAIPGRWILHNLNHSYDTQNASQVSQRCERWNSRLCSVDRMPTPKKTRVLQSHKKHSEATKRSRKRQVIHHCSEFLPWIVSKNFLIAISLINLCSTITTHGLFGKTGFPTPWRWFLQRVKSSLVSQNSSKQLINYNKLINLNQLLPFNSCACFNFKWNYAIGKICIIM